MPKSSKVKPPARAGEKPERRGHLDDETIAKAIVGSLGNVAFIARTLEVSRVTVWRRIKQSQMLKDVYHEENETMLDNAENELRNLMNPQANADPRSRLNALTYYLDAKGKSRGYGKQRINVGVDLEPLQPVLNFTDKQDGKK